MTRKFAALLLVAILPFAGCKKLHLPFGKKAAPEPVAAAPAEAAPSAPAAPAPIAAVSEAPAVPVAAAPSAPAAPSKPDLTPAVPVKAAVDTSASVMVLCYHNIEDSKRNLQLTLPVAEFEKELGELKTAGFTVIPMQDFLAWRRGDKNIPHKSCVITLDDGWVSAYNTAWPILKKYGYPFTLFIYIEYVGSGGKSMTWDQLAEMRDAGVDIQCHTFTHSNLHGKATGTKPKEVTVMQQMGYEPWLRKEIIDSKKVLEDKLGIKVNAIAYPYGVWNSEVRKVVKEAGYEAGFTVYGQRIGMHSPPSDLLGRYAVEAKQPKIFADALTMLGGGVAAADNNSSSIGQLASASMITKPMNGETVNTTKPVISANLATMGAVEPGSVKVFLSGVGPLQVQYSPDTKMMTAAVVQPLKPGAYSVIVAAKVGGQNQETRWVFNVSATATNAAPAPGAAATPIPPTPPKL